MNTPEPRTAHFVPPDTDCNGWPTLGYWREFLPCSDGVNVTGIGATAEEAEMSATYAKATRERFLRSPASERLRAAAKAGLRCTDEADIAIRAIAEILLGKL